MTKYLTTIEVEAVQWFPGKELEGLFDKGQFNARQNRFIPEPYVIGPNYQDQKVEEGDWLIYIPGNDKNRPLLVKNADFLRQYIPKQVAITEESTNLSKETIKRLQDHGTADSK